MAPTSPPSPTFKTLLAESRFDPLNFSDVSLLSEDNKRAAIECFEEAVAVLLDKIGFRYTVPERDGRLREDLSSWAQANLIGSCLCEKKVLDRILDATLSCVESFYPLAQHDTRLQMAIAIGAGIVAEDGFASPDSDHIFSAFQYNLWCRDPDEDEGKWSRMYSSVIKNFIQHFGAIDRRVGTLGGNGLANFMEACHMENSFAKVLPPHLSYVPPGAKMNLCCPDGFAYFFRSITGATVPCILGIFKPSRETEVPLEYWITSMVPLTTFINLANDILSLSKEIRTGETNNYMSLQTRARRQGSYPSSFAGPQSVDDQWTFRDTIAETLDSVYQCTLSLDRAFVEFAEYVECSYLAITGLPC